MKTAIEKKAGALVMLGAFMMLLLAGCHTTAGVGEDLQSAGRGIERGANSANR